jgi:hypothetical protein
LVVGVEQWAEIRRMYRVERLSIREVHRRTGLHRKTIRRALASDQPRVYRRAPAGSKLDPFRDWIEEKLRADPRIPSMRLRELAEELGDEGGKTIFDDFVREVRPRYLVRRTFQPRSIGLASCASLICGGRASRSRSAMASGVAAGWSRLSCAGRGRWRGRWSSPRNGRISPGG